MNSMERLEIAASEAEKKRIILELELKCVELILRGNQICLGAFLSLKVPYFDYGELKFPLPGFIIAHPECWGFKFSELFGGDDEDSLRQELPSG